MGMIKSVDSLVALKSGKKCLMNFNLLLWCSLLVLLKYLGYIGKISRLENENPPFAKLKLNAFLQPINTASAPL